MKTVAELRSILETRKDGSAWSRGVTKYALELLEDFESDFEFYGSPADEKALLNGAENWIQFSYGGCSLIFNSDIAERLCCPSELRRYKNGERNFNQNENWLDVQARALNRASNRIRSIARK